MIAPESHRSYDVFKLLVALLLLAILIVLMLRPAPPARLSGALPASAATETQPPASTPPTAVQPTATLPGASTATAQPSATPAPTATATKAPTATLMVTATLEAASTPSPTAVVTSTLAITPTATAAVVSGPVDCPLALPTRLKVADTVVTTDNVNLRSSPEIRQNILSTTIRGTQLEIIGGPVCGPYEGGAYLWWQVRRADGQVGWSAEAALTGRLYLLQPVP